jgi:tetratricopeptide (TPR) repeat protein
MSWHRYADPFAHEECSAMVERKTRSLLHEPTAGLSAAAVRLLQRADEAMANKQLDVAESALIATLAIAPDCVEAQRQLGVILQMRGDHAQAIAILRQALALSSDSALVHMNLGSALYSSGAVDEALTHARRASELASELPAAWFNLGKIYDLQNQPGPARDALQRALQLDPDHLAARMVLAKVQISQGDIDEATTNYRAVLRRRPGHVNAWIALANLGTVRLEHNDVITLRRALQAPAATPDARVALGFTLAKALDDQGDHESAFEALSRANSLKRRRVEWNDAAMRADVEAIFSAFAEPVAGAADATLGREVIFIICLPRSGSSLTEQILATHPDVEGAGELTDLHQVIDQESRRRGQPFPLWVAAATPTDWSRLGGEYLARTANWRRQRPRSADKNAINWQFVGAAAAMLPGARMVHSHRDPLETCLGCYRQLFNSGNHFSYDLGDMASYWNAYDRLTRHWAQLYPERFFDHSYEALLADPEDQVRRLLAACDLPYDPACMEFHRTQRIVRTASADQVRQPLRRDTARSAWYGDKLDHLRALLHDAY